MKLNMKLRSEGFGRMAFPHLAAFSPDGNVVAIPIRDGTIRLWDIAADKLTKELKPSVLRPQRDKFDMTCAYSRLLFSSEGKQLFAATDDSTISRWDVATGKELPALASHHGHIQVLLLAKNGKQLLSMCSAGMIRRWDIASGQEIAPPDGYTGDLFARLSPDAKSVLLLDVTGRMDIWDLATGQLRVKVRAPTKPGIETFRMETRFGFAPDGKQVYLAEGNGTVTTWDAASGKSTRSIKLGGYTDRGNSLSFCVPVSDSQTFVVSQRPRRVALVDAATRKEMWQTQELTPYGICSPPAVSPDGKAIWLGVSTFQSEKVSPELRGRLEMVRLEAATGKVMHRIKLDSLVQGTDVGSFDQPRITPDGRILIVHYEGSEAHVLDVVANKRLHRHILVTVQCAIGPDGKWIIEDGIDEIVVRDAATRKELFRLPIGKLTVNSLHVLPDGKRLFTSGQGGHACLWELKPP